MGGFTLAGPWEGLCDDAGINQPQTAPRMAPQFVGTVGSSKPPMPGLSQSWAHARVLYLVVSEHFPYRRSLAAKYLSSYQPDFGFWVAPFSVFTCSQEWYGAGCTPSTLPRGWAWAVSASPGLCTQQNILPVIMCLVYTDAFLGIFWNV